MSIKHVLFCFAFFFITIASLNGQIVNPDNRVCGKWESTDRDLIIQVYKQDGQFRAKILWFADTDGKPLDYWKDVHNPNPALRGRKLLGMGILKNLTYQPETGTWENGMVYDSRHGREWNASAYIGRQGLLHVRGYWHFKFIGRTMTFKKIK